MTSAHQIGRHVRIERAAEPLSRTDPARISHGVDVGGHAGGMTTKIGFAIILAGVLLIGLRAANIVDSEMADIVSVLSIVVGALAVAIDGEAADQTTKPKRRNSGT